MGLTWFVKRDLASHMARSVRENGLELLQEGLNILESLSSFKLSLLFVWERLQSDIHTSTQVTRIDVHTKVSAQGVWLFLDHVP